jgi:hypothetical protein
MTAKKKVFRHRESNPGLAGAWRKRTDSDESGKS